MRRVVLLPVLLALALLPLAALVCATAQPALGADRARATTEHYEFTTSGPQSEADEWSRMLEAAWPQFAEFFDAEPKLAKDERLRVALYDDPDAWRAAIVAGGGAAPDSGGYYCPAARVAYLKRQPSAWYTRTLLLHEAAHQFHYFARSGHDKPAGNWYVEGVAEHLGSHSWDGETLRVGVTPLVSLEDRSGNALAAISRDDFSTAALVEAETASRPEAMFLVRYLAEQHAKRFTPLARKLDRGTALDAKGLRRAFGKPDAFLDAWRAWLRERQEPFVSVFVEWDARGPDLLHGTAQVVSLCRTRSAATGIVATVSARGDRPLRAGAVLSVSSPTEYVIGVVDERSGVARLQVDRMSGGRWKRMGDVAVGDASPTGWRVECSRREGGVTLTATRADATEAAASLGPFDLPEAPMGLSIDACDAAFSGIEVR